MLSRKLEDAFKYKSCKYITCVILSGHVHNTFNFGAFRKFWVFKKIITIILNYFKPTLGQRVTDEI